MSSLHGGGGGSSSPTNRSFYYRTPHKNSSSSQQQQSQPPPIDPLFIEFVEIIEDTPQEEWKKRTTSFERLIESIPRDPTQLFNNNNSNNGSPNNNSRTTTTGIEPKWYNTASTLRQLHRPISELLKDPRSTVVKRTCQCLTDLFGLCQHNARHLFKEIMHTILAVHAQTLAVMRTAVQNMVLDTIPDVPCRSVMPIWMDRLKVDKSRTVRDACAIYLGQALKSWNKEPNYLTEDIWIQVGNILIKSLRDPSPNVRESSKTALEYMRLNQIRYWEQLIENPDGPAARDPKLRRWLKSLGGNNSNSNTANNNNNDIETEELSVASKISYNSDTRFASSRPIGGGGGVRGNSSTGISLPSPRNKLYHMMMNEDHHSTSSNNGGGLISGMVPASIQVKTKPPHSSSSSPDAMGLSGGGGQQHRALLASGGGSSSSSRRGSTATTTTTTTRPTTTTTSGEDLLEPIKDLTETSSSANNNNNNVDFFPSSLNGSYFNNNHHSPRQQQQKQQHNRQQQQQYSPSKSIDDNNDEASNKTGSSSRQQHRQHQQQLGPFIANIQELKQHASKRRGRNSLLMEERFKLSQTNLLTSSISSLGPMTAVGLVPTDQHLNNNDVTNHSEDNDDGEEQNAVTQSGNVTADVNDVGGGSNGADAVAPGGVSSQQQQQQVQTQHEHVKISVQLLRAHKLHVDRIMETLRIEMDALRDFDRLLEQQPKRPTEEEVLVYFESVEICLQQRTMAANKLRNEMDRISRGTGSGSENSESSTNNNNNNT